MSYQVLRIEKFSKGGLGKIGAETERTAKQHRNEDIDRERTPLNYYFKKSDGGLIAQWKKTMQDFGASFKETKKAVAFEGVIITSDKDFFQERGYIPGEPLPRELQKFFADSYAFILRQIGYHGTDKNILSAVVHLDETTPHLQLYYLPIVDEGRKKVYAKGADGKVLRNERGSPVQAKDKNGKSIYERTRSNSQSSALRSFGNSAARRPRSEICKTNFISRSPVITDWNAAKSAAAKSTRPNINGKSNSKKRSLPKKLPHSYKRRHRSKKRTRCCKTSVIV